jgi:ankyrin repeat protein
LLANDFRLVEAAKDRDIESVRSLLKQHLEVNDAQPDGATPLAWAVHWDDMEMAGLLISAGAKVNAANEYGVTPLSLACTNGSAPMVQKLLNAGADPKATLGTGETVLMTCARTGNVEAVSALVARGADPNLKEKERGQTAIMWAVAERHPQVVKYLSEHGADVHSRSKSGFTPLLFAAQEGDLDSARILLAAGANVSEATPGGVTALSVAALNGHEDVALFLLDKGADPNGVDAAGVTPLHYAVRIGFLLPGDEFGQKPLVYYQYRPKMLDLIKALLVHGANPNARVAKRQPLLLSRGIDEIGATPLLLAAADLDVSVMRALAAGGSDPRIPNKQGITPLMVAAGLSRPKYAMDEEEEKAALESVKLLAELGADVNAASDSGLTAVHAAAYVGASSVIQFLADKEAKLDVKDKVIGQTPLTIAEGVFPTGKFLNIKNYSVSTKDGLSVNKPLGFRERASTLLRRLTGDTTKFTCPGYLFDPYNHLQPTDLGEVRCSTVAEK